MPSMEKVSKRSKGELRPVIKSADPNFNHEAAQQAVEMVMKMDQEEAEMFTYFVMAEILEDDIEKNQRTLQRHINEVAKMRIEKVRKALLSSVSKSSSTEALAYAEALVEIEKAYQNPYTTGHYEFEETDFRRDPQTGRFMTKVSVNRQMKPLNDKQAENLGIGTKQAKYKALTKPSDKARYQQEYMQVANFLNAVNSSSKDPANTQMFLRLRDKGGNQYWKTVNGKPDWDPREEQVVAVEARPNGLSLGGAAFGLTNALGQPQIAGINRADAHFDSFANDWVNTDYDTRNSNERLYNRVKTGSEFVQQVAPWGSKAAIAARFGVAVGEHGPQAERVLGPTARKTAYRYRGTEKTPESRVVREFNVAAGRAQQPVLTPEQTKQLKSRQARREKAWQVDEAKRTGKPVESIRIPADVAQEIRSSTRKTFMEQVQAKPDPEKRAAGLAVFRDYFTARGTFDDRKSQIPNRDLYNLQLHAGNTPPSEGFIIDKTGKVVTQAVGYGDDHYLPFNLRNLKALRGGEYVRSRSVGGPTTEDIYTGLMAGASRVTVVSRSGVFTVDFEDDFKGKRRYNDKARRMTKRYESLLDAVQSEQVRRNTQISPEVKAKIVTDINTSYRSLAPEHRRTLIKQKTAEYQEAIASAESKEEFRAYAEAAAGNLEGRDRQDFIAQTMNDYTKHTEYMYKLNGQGYADALQALQEQFPYYIKVNHQPKQDMDRFETELDRGYVEPKRNRPTEAKAGQYGTAVRLGEAWGNKPVQGKFSASQADYQGQGPGKRTAAAATAAGGAAAAAPIPTTDGETAERVSEVQTKVANQKGEESAMAASVALVNVLKKHNVDISAAHAVVREAAAAQDDEGIKAVLKDKSKMRAFDNYFRASVDFSKEEFPDEIREVFKNYRRASGLSQRVPYAPERALTRSGPPFLFNGAAYEPGADPSLVEAEVARVSASTRPVSIQGRRLEDLTDAELENEIDVLVRVNNGLTTLQGTPKERLPVELGALGIDTDIDGVSEIIDKGKINTHAKNVQRMRALNLNRGQRAQEGSILAPSGPNPREPVVAGVRQDHIPDRTPEQIQAVKGRASVIVTAYEEAARALDDRGDRLGDDRAKDAASLMRVASSDLKQKIKNPELDEAIFRAARDGMGPYDALALKAQMGTLEETDIEEFLRELES